MRKLMLPLAACAAFGVSAAPALAESANVKQNKKIGTINGAVKGLQRAIQLINDTNLGQTGSVNDAHAKIDALTATVSTLATVASKALGDINAALTNSTTGLVGLNLARPQFGAFTGAGVIQGGTGLVSGASGPKSNAVVAAGGMYIIDFGNDVSSRMYTVTPLPGSTAAGAGMGQAANCSNASFSGTCGGMNAASAGNKNHVLVQFGSGATAPTGFYISAISG